MIVKTTAKPHQGWIVYHYPFNIKVEDSGSSVHLTQMYQAFQRAGYEITLISGWAEDRKKAIQQVKDRIRVGDHPDFLYIWAPVIPSLSSRNIYHPFLDFSFFRWCKRHHIPIGVFYGDVHWRFPHFKGTRPWYRRMPLIPLYWMDWLHYLRIADCIFLPSLAMRSALPTSWPEEQTQALYPGCNIVSDHREAVTPEAPLRLFYVGGVTPPLYDLSPLFRTIEIAENVQLTLCCREAEWQKARMVYPQLGDDKLRVLHAHGAQLEPLYATADIACLFWSPNPYMAFAMPVKVFEALGHALPIITTAGTEIARFIETEGIGWTVKTPDECRSLLNSLQDDPELWAEKQLHAAIVRHRHTWDQRATQIANSLKKAAARRM